MGQYFMVGLKKKNGKKWQIYRPHGFKLMEHSYIGNDVCNAICKLLYKKPAYVMWCGDYWEPGEMKLPSYSSDPVKPTKEEFWADKVKEKEVSDDTFEIRGKYLINLDSKEYIDMSEYIESASVGQFTDDGWAVHPLPLLTANSNGQGGGDYYEEYPNADLCGTWADCLIVIDDKPPKGFTNRQDIFFAEMCHVG